MIKRIPATVYVGSKPHPDPMLRDVIRDQKRMPPIGLNGLGGPVRYLD